MTRVEPHFEQMGIENMDILSGMEDDEVSSKHAGMRAQERYMWSEKFENGLEPTFTLAETRGKNVPRLCENVA